MRKQDGKNAKFMVPPQAAGTTLRAFIAENASCSARQAKAWLDQRLVFVNGRRIWMAKHALQANDRVEILQSGIRQTKVPPKWPVLFANEDYFVVNKPAGWISNGPGSIETQWQQTARWATARAAHRLDRDTTGTLCAACNEAAYNRLVAAFRAGQVLKIYHAIVQHGPRARTGVIRQRLEGKTAVTHWTVLQQNEWATHLKCRIDTGRTHQIRKHCQQQGWPVLGDRQYAEARLRDPRLRTVPRQMLHAAVLQAPLGVHGEVVRVEAPLPADFKQALKAFHLA